MMITLQQIAQALGGQITGVRSLHPVLVTVSMIGPSPYARL